MKQKKGVALLWALILSAVLILISTTMANYIIKESRFSVNIEESSRAYTAAKSGIEWALAEAETSTNAAIATATFDFINTGDGIDTTVTFTGDCRNNCTISSESITGTVTRKIEYYYTRPAPKLVDIKDPLSSINMLEDYPPSSSNYGSFNWSFDFWTNTNSITQEGANYFGLGTNTQGIYFKTSSTSHNAQVAANTTAGLSTASTPLSFSITGDAHRAKPYRYHVDIKYLEDTAASIRLSKRLQTGETEPGKSTGDLVCLGYSEVDLIGADFGNLSSLFFAGTRFQAATNPVIPGKLVIRNENAAEVDFYYDNLQFSKY